MNDRELTDAFASLRAQDAEHAPPFSAPAEPSATARLISSASTRRLAWLVAAGILGVLAAGAAITMTFESSRQPQTISTWRSPTHGLLSSTNLAIMTTPRIEAASIMALPTTHKETQK